MAEATFAKTFLTTIDSRPIKLSPDHVEDPKRFPARSPYILPRMPKAMSKPSNLAPGQEKSITVTLKSLRNPPLDIKLTSQPPSTSILDVKGSVSKQARIPLDKLKVLHNKRPVQDSKILKDLVGETDNSIEFSVMVMGGAASILPEEPEKDQGGASLPPTGAAALDTPEFWSDLHGFLMQRLKDQDKASELSKLFKSSWEGSQARP
ncbi:hypothetical protein HJFPF1_06483 [Paramyrothecium foliicola]|nr:hypothetical protein HJFPF1_06483 [Paramyrothecium foliicola]